MKMAKLSESVVKYVIFCNNRFCEKIAQNFLPYALKYTILNFKSELFDFLHNKKLQSTFKKQPQDGSDFCLLKVISNSQK